MGAARNNKRLKERELKKVQKYITNFKDGLKDIKMSEMSEDEKKFSALMCYAAISSEVDSYKTIILNPNYVLEYLKGEEIESELIVEMSKPLF